MDQPPRFVALAASAQVLFIILFGACTKYDDNTATDLDDAEATGAAEMSTYPMWQDTHVMIFVGFGFLMTFLRAYGFSSLTINFLVSVVGIQWGILVMGFFHLLFHGHLGDAKIPLHLTQLVEGDFAAATALISLGAVLGTTSPSQTLAMVCFEVIFYALNFHVGITGLKVADIGGTMMIHSFGAYFGLAFSWAMGPRGRKDHKNNASVYHSDMFAMIGTLFLWVFWPSFVSVLASGNAQNRCVMHTLLSLCASCLSGCVASAYLREGHKFDMVDVQNATLAGGVTIGAVADHYLGGGGALIIGSAAGVLSVVGYVYVAPWLEAHGLHDTCGVHNLHGLPGVLGGLASVISAACASDLLYGDHVGDVFSAMDPPKGRSATEQAGCQLLALVVTLAISISGGVITGLVCRSSAFLDVPMQLFTDATIFETPEADGPQLEDGQGNGDKARTISPEGNGIELKNGPKTLPPLQKLGNSSGIQDDT